MHQIDLSRIDANAVDRTVRRFKEAMRDLARGSTYWTHCPEKFSHDYSESEFVNIMSCFYRGASFVKLIRINDQTHTTTFSQSMIGFDGTLSVSTDPEFTYLRCALMALMYTNDLPRSARIGLLGKGKINRLVNWLLRWSGFENVEFIDSRRVRQNYGEHPFELIISASTNTELVNTYDPGEARVIAFDGGWTIDPMSRRGHTLYSDYPAQLVKSFKKEFPFDLQQHTFEFATGVPTQDMRHIYLYGTALFDLITFQEFIQ